MCLDQGRKQKFKEENCSGRCPHWSCSYALDLFFIQYVKKQLWEQSVSAIMESTSQGCNALQMQLQHDFASMKLPLKK